MNMGSLKLKDWEGVISSVLGESGVSLSPDQECSLQHKPRIEKDPRGTEG